MFKNLIAAVVVIAFSAGPVSAQKSETTLPDLPHAITSFGAATTQEGHLYVYGGHKGDAHHYNIEGQSNALLRLNLKSPTKWESLPAGPRLQGLALVTDGKYIYRVGGFTAMNKGEDKQKLSSQKSVARFDPKTNSWTDLTPLPEPRSSFDAVTHQGKLYVIGGWNMQPEATEWLSTAWVADLKTSPLKWQELPKPPFQRRALSLAAVGDSVYAVGGMTTKGPTKAVSVFNTKDGTWKEAPELPGKNPMSGFGSSSFTIGSRLFASTYDGSVLELAADGGSWKVFQTLPEGRFFHRMVPMNKSALLLISGANMETGKYEDIITVSIDK